MHLFSLIILMIASGILGGLINFYIDKDNKNTTNTPWEYMVIGIGASLLVPLFLNMIASDLIIESEKSHNDILVIMGFCLVASISSRSFIKSISDKAIQKARSAERKADKVAATLTLSERRANSIIMPLVMIELTKFDQAIADLDNVLRNDPEFSEAWAWRGYAQKRVGKFEDAVASMENALKYEKEPDLGWHYNLACYKALARRDVTEVIQELNLIKNSKDKRRNDLLSALKSDDDFASIREHDAFKEIIFAKNSI